MLDLDGPNHDGGEVIVSGSDFVSSLRLNRAANKLAWLTWNHPNMPWDATLLSRATLTPEGTLSDIQIVAGGPQESVILPGWDNLDRLLFVSDQSGWWHLYRNDGTSESVQLTTGEREFGVPLAIRSLDLDRTGGWHDRDRLDDRAEPGSSVPESGNA